MIVLNEIEKKIQKTLLQVIKGLNNPPTLRIAGGWVRDKLLGLSSNDIDIAIDNMNGEPFAHLVKEYMNSLGGGMSQVTKIQLNPEKSKHLETATARLYGLDIDFVNLRSETYNDDSRHPTVTFGSPLQDALRRDITINALFYNLHTEQVEDFTGFGLLDMKEKRIRTPLPELGRRYHHFRRFLTIHCVYCE
jgi:tRNA nucleotidyltransferase (CCA-adding enzyme)